LYYISEGTNKLRKAADPVQEHLLNIYIDFHRPHDPLEKRGSLI